MRIILLGKMGAGKDTVAEILKEYGFKRYAFADKVKQVASEIFPEIYNDSKRRRWLLQTVGTDMFRSIDQNCWTSYLMQRANENYAADGHQIITDCRFFSELNAGKQNGFIPVRVICEDDIRIARLIDRDGAFDPATMEHVSETELDAAMEDYRLYNHDMRSDLAYQVQELIDKIDKKTCRTCEVYHRDLFVPARAAFRECSGCDSDGLRNWQPRKEICK